MNLSRGVREHALLALVFVSSRLILLWAGLRFKFSLDWMWLSDPADLQDRLLETIYYFHAFPPGMNLLSGVLLKLAGPHAATVAVVLFWTLGYVLVESLFYLARVSGLSTRAALMVAIAFALLPQSIYFEHLYLYEEPVAALLCLSVALFHVALTRQSFRWWLAFFATCSAIGVTRSTFHLVWFAVMLAAGLWFSAPAIRRRIVLAAAFPATLLVAVYVKNLIVFGTFAAFTYGPSSYAHVTVSHLPADVKATWVRQHRLSPYAALSPYAGPREYLRVFPSRQRTDLPSQLTQLDRPTVHAPNFNHWVILEANRQRASDAWYYLRTEPLDYATNVLRGVRDFFGPTTEWHPYSGTARSPHSQHAQVLGPFESLFNRLIHRFPVAPVGVYIFLPLVLLWAARRAWVLLRSSDRWMYARGATLGLCLMNVAFVVAVSSAFTFLESSRYRYQIESLIALLTALCLAELSGAIRQRQVNGKTVSGEQFP